MAPIPQQIITATICNRTNTEWQWISSGDPLLAEKGTLTKVIPAKSRISLKHTLQSNAQLLATLRCNTKSTGSPQSSVDVKLDIDTSSQSSRSCFSCISSSKSIPQWLSYPIPLSSGKLLYRQVDDKHFDFLILPAIPPSSFLSALPDNALLSQICLPGTHESLARYGWPISTCQSTQSTVQKQLQDGIRYLDIRLVPKGEPGQTRLLAYHGITDQRIEFGAVLTQCWQFLQSEKGRRETIIMSIKQESGFKIHLFEHYLIHMWIKHQWVPMENLQEGIDGFSKIECPN